LKQFRGIFRFLFCCSLVSSKEFKGKLNVVRERERERDFKLPDGKREREEVEETTTKILIRTMFP
jgi:hypothetical protein